MCGCWACLKRPHLGSDVRALILGCAWAVVIGPVSTKAHTKASAVFIREVIFGNPVLTFPSTYVDGPPANQTTPILTPWPVSTDTRGHAIAQCATWRPHT